MPTSPATWPAAAALLARHAAPLPSFRPRLVPAVRSAARPCSLAVPCPCPTPGHASCLMPSRLPQPAARSPPALCSDRQQAEGQ
jgi:hypothetical protein